MLDLFYAGGLFMPILTLLLLIILAVAIYYGVNISNQKFEHITSLRHRLKYIKSMGLFALVFGLFGQLMGLYQMFSVIEVAGVISPAIVAGGLKVTMISVLYGVVIFLISYLAWLGLDYMLDGKKEMS